LFPGRSINEGVISDTDVITFAIIKIRNIVQSINQSYISSQALLVH
jgi:hypothetical protein